MQDQFGRTIDYLRISVTDRCNLRCAYCMPCPAGLNIPSLINKYNNTALYDFEEVKKDYMSSEVKADACIGCHACEAECPQHLKPSELMPKIHALFTK